MSIKLMTAAWTLEVSATEKLVLLALADWANDDGHCWPSMSQLAAKSGLTDRAVQKAIQRLAADGHLTRQEVTGKGVNYFVHPGTTFTPERRSPPNETTKTPERRSPNTSVTTIKDEANASSKARVSKRNGFALPDWVPAEAWAGYEQMRCKARKPMTDRARALALTKLQELAASGHPPGEVLDQSTLNNWQGLFEIKERNNGNSLGRHHGQGGGERRPSASIDWIERNLGRASEADEGPHGVHRGTLVAIPSSAGR
jgi:hypothetical protein